MKISFSKDEEASLKHSIKRFFQEELELEVNDLQSGFILKYFTEEIAPFAYNKGVEDSESFIQDKMQDLTAICFEEPFSYWNKKQK